VKVSLSLSLSLVGSRMVINAYLYYYGMLLRLFQRDLHRLQNTLQRYLGFLVVSCVCGRKRKNVSRFLSVTRYRNTARGGSTRRKIVFLHNSPCNYRRAPGSLACPSTRGTPSEKSTKECLKYYLTAGFLSGTRQ